MCVRGLRCERGICTCVRVFVPVCVCERGICV